MFDDSTNQPGAGAPPNLPVGEPADIFADSDKVDPPAAAPAPAAQPDQPAQPATPSALSSGALKPKQPTAPPAGSPAPKAGAPTAPPTIPQTLASVGVNQIKGPGLSKGIMMAVIVIIVLIIIVGGGWWVYASFIKSDSSAGSFTPSPAPVVNTPPVETVVEEPAPVITPPASEAEDEVTEDEPTNSFDNVILFGEQVDTDGDGLDDAREASIGTDPNNWDSDGDELSDFDEVSVWNTDPFNVDSDGDGFEDGAEVKNGYSPSGPGKIFEPPVNKGTDTTLDESTSAGFGEEI